MVEIPEFKSAEEEAQFWDTVDTTEFLDEFEEVVVELDESVKSPRDLSPRCPKCGEVLLSRYVDRDAAGGLVTVHRVRELYCPQGHHTELAEESRELIAAVEDALASFESPAEEKIRREKMAA